MSDIWVKKIEELRKALEEGREVVISGIPVRRIEYRKTRRGGVLVIINNGELVEYATKLFTRKIEIR
jgi:hypothetical protein